jgi:hypothetical protein
LFCEGLFPNRLKDSQWFGEFTINRLKDETDFFIL